MKNILALLTVLFVFNAAKAQTDTTLNKYIDNGLISIADKKWHVVANC